MVICKCKLGCGKEFTLKCDNFKVLLCMLEAIQCNCDLTDTEVCYEKV